MLGRLKASSRRYLRMAVPWICILLGTISVALYATLGPAFARETVTLRVIDTFRTVEDRKVIEKAFESKHPDIKIEWIDTAGMDAKAKLLVLIAGGVPPDIYIGDIHHVGYDVTIAHFRDLTPMWNEDSELRAVEKQFFPAALANTKFKGRMYSLPGPVCPAVHFVNLDILEQSGIDYPEKPWTWTELVKNGLKLTRDTNGDGTIDQWAYDLATWLPGYYPYVWERGGDLYQWHPTEGYAIKSAIDQPEFYETLQWYADLALKLKIAPRPGEGGAWEAGKLVIKQAWSGAIPAFQKSVGFKWDAMFRPVYKEGSLPVELLGVWTNGGCILKASKHPQEAWEFIKFYSSQEAQELLARSQGGPGALGSLPILAGTPFFNEWLTSRMPPRHRGVLLASAQYGRPAPYPIYGHTDMGRIFSEAVQPVFEGKVQAETVCKQVAPLINRIFKEGEKKGYYKLPW